LSLPNISTWNNNPAL